MDSVVLDTNVLIDFLSIARPEHNLAIAMVRTLQASAVKVHIVATSLKDIYYVLSRYDGETVARAAVTTMVAIFTILPVNGDCCRRALACGEPDFEAGIIRAAAEIARVDYIVSRDTHAFVGSLVPCLSPTQALRELNRRPQGFPNSV